MKPEERLFDLIGTLPDDITAQTEAPKRKKISPKQRNRWIGIAVAACLVIAVGVWGMTETPAYTKDDYATSTPAPGLPETPAYTKDDYATSTPAPGLPGPELNWPIPSGNTSLMALHTTMLPVGDRVAEYQQVENPHAIPKEERPQYLGDPYLDLEGWYRPALTGELRYLVHVEEDGSYTLWEFSSFAVLDEQAKAEMAENLENSIWATVEWFSLDLNFDPYPYSEVLEAIYGITSAEDIRSITVKPATMDNTDAGKKLQKKIGTHAVWKQEELAVFYEALSSSVCCGANQWERINLGGTDPDGGLSNQVRLCRYLTVETTHGTIDSLKYSAAGGQFYEFSGIAYEPLDDDAAAELNGIFKIES